MKREYATWRQSFYAFIDYRIVGKNKHISISKTVQDIDAEPHIREELIGDVERFHKQYDFDYGGRICAYKRGKDYMLSFSPYPKGKTLSAINSITFRGGLEDISNAATVNFVKARDDGLSAVLRFNRDLYWLDLNTAQKENKDPCSLLKDKREQGNDITIINTKIGPWGDTALPVLELGTKFDRNDKSSWKHYLPEKFTGRLLIIYKPEMGDVSIPFAHGLGLIFVGDEYFDQEVRYKRLLELT